MKLFSDLSDNQLILLKQELEQKYEDFKKRNLKLDMSRGKPSTEQVELSMDMLGCLTPDSDCRDANGVDCRNYGNILGIPEARKLFAEIFDVCEDEIIVGGNSSLNMMFDTIAQAMGNGLLGHEPWTKQGQVKFICPCPGYDRHFAICEYFGIDMIPVKIDADGPDMDAIESLVNNDPLVKGIWCVPKYSNPTGVTYSDEVVRRFANLRPAAPDFRIFWDNSYFAHNLFGEDTKLLNLLKEAEKAGNPNMVYMYFSTSKITFPGSGLAGMATSVENVNAIIKRKSAQTIGPDKLNQLRHMKFIKDLDGLLAQMEKHANVMRPRFTCVLDMLEKELGNTGIADWTNPKGGYFVSFNAPAGCAKKIVSMCSEAGVTLTDAGATFPYGNDPLDSNIRIAPTFPPVNELKLSMELFCICVKIAAIEKRLGPQ